MTGEIKTPSVQRKGRLSAVFGRHAPVGALARGLSHQLMCGGIMLTGHLLAGPVPAVGEVMSHPATNLGLMSLAAWCWHRGDKHWMHLRGKLARTWEKVAARGVIAAAGVGMIYMHSPGGPMSGHHHHGGHEGHDHMHMHGAAEGGPRPGWEQDVLDRVAARERQRVEKDPMMPSMEQRQAWIESLGADGREKWKKMAKQAGMNLEEYAGTLCGLPPAPSRDMTRDRKP